MDLDELLEWIKERMEEGEYATVETFLRDMDEKGRGADEFRTSAEAKQAEMQATIDELTKGNQDLKARNYDLLMQVPADEEEIDPVDDIVEEDGEVIHIDDLFVSPDDEEKE